MIKNINILLTLCVLFLFSCGNGNAELEAEREKAFKDVMKVHDEMMVMGKIRGAQGKLKKMMEADSTNAAKFQTAIDQLQTADDAMMGWMKQFKNPSQDTDPKEAIEYLKDQKIKVDKMKAIMEENMKKAREVIEF